MEPKPGGAAISRDPCSEDNMTQRGTDRGSWPDLPYSAWREARETLHLWTQIVGKIRLSQTPWLNHSWHVVLYVSPRGLTTSSIPYGFELKLDFLNHALVATADDGSIRKVGLYPRSVAASRSAFMTCLTSCPIRSASTRTIPTRPTIATLPNGIGASWLKSSGCSSSSARPSLASAARSISSGEASILPSLAF